jgi:hypothetical protein
MTARPSPSMEAVLARMLAEDGALPDATTLSPSDGWAQTERVVVSEQCEQVSGLR